MGAHSLRFSFPLSGKASLRYRSHDMKSRESETLQLSWTNREARHRVEYNPRILHTPAPCEDPKHLVFLAYLCQFSKSKSHEIGVLRSVEAKNGRRLPGTSPTVARSVVLLYLWRIVVAVFTTNSRALRDFRGRIRRPTP